MIDSHIHLDRLERREIERAVERGIVMWSSISDYESGIKILELKREFPENIKIFVGMHPEDPERFGDCEKLLELLAERDDEIDGVGEVGVPAFYLDRFDTAALEKGVEIFESFVRYAGERKLPVILHIVGEDIYKVLPILDRYRIERAMFHWYVGGRKEISEIVKRGYLLSVNIECREDDKYRDYVKTLPPGNCLLETDAPYGYQRTTSVLEIEGMYGVLAEIWGESSENIKGILEKNAADFLKRKSLKDDVIMDIREKISDCN